GGARSRRARRGPRAWRPADAAASARTCPGYSGSSGRHLCARMSTRSPSAPSPTKATPSALSSATCSSPCPTLYVEIPPAAFTTRCHGTSPSSSRRPYSTAPTWRAACGAPTVSATCPYLTTLPWGTALTASRTRLRKEATPHDKARQGGLARIGVRLEAGLESGDRHLRLPDERVRHAHHRLRAGGGRSHARRRPEGRRAGPAQHLRRARQARREGRVVPRRPAQAASRRTRRQGRPHVLPG